MEKQTKQLSIPSAIIVAGFLIMVGLIVTKMPAQNTKVLTDKKQVAEEPAGAVAQVPVAPIDTTDHVRGNANTAQLTIVEYSDTECPFCKTFHTVIQKAFTKYPGKIAWVYRHFPLDSLHPKARNEARATECVASIGGNDAFWKYIDMIFVNTPSNNKMDPALLPAYAAKIGIDKTKFATCFASTDMDAKVEADYQDGVRIGVRGTPHTVLILPDGTQIPILGADEAKFNLALDTYFK